MDHRLEWMMLPIGSNVVEAETEDEDMDIDPRTPQLPATLTTTQQQHQTIHLCSPGSASPRGDMYKSSRPASSSSSDYSSASPRPTETGQRTLHALLADSRLNQQQVRADSFQATSPAGSHEAGVLSSTPRSTRPAPSASPPAPAHRPQTRKRSKRDEGAGSGTSAWDDRHHAIQGHGESCDVSPRDASQFSHRGASLDATAAASSPSGHQDVYFVDEDPRTSNSGPSHPKKNKDILEAREENGVGPRKASCTFTVTAHWEEPWGTTSSGSGDSESAAVNANLNKSSGHPQLYEGHRHQQQQSRGGVSLPLARMVARQIAIVRAVLEVVNQETGNMVLLQRMVEEEQQQRQRESDGPASDIAKGEAEGAGLDGRPRPETEVFE